MLCESANFVHLVLAVLLHSSFRWDMRQAGVEPRTCDEGKCTSFRLSVYYSLSTYTGHGCSDTAVNGMAHGCCRDLKPVVQLAQG